MATCRRFLQIHQCLVGNPLVRTRIFSLLLVALSTLVSLAAGEALLRLKNSNMTNYDIEMWRYSNALKVKNPNPDIAFTHRKNDSALLQSVTIRTNGLGLRGGAVEPLAPGGRRVLFLGGSITLGWGVAEEQTLTAQLEKKLRAAGQTVQVLNGGIGNYNAVRYTNRFFAELQPLRPTDIVVQYFLRDGEDLQAGGGNFLLEHSQLAVTMWIAKNRLFEAKGLDALNDHYRLVYALDSPGFLKMKVELKRLADYAKARGIRLYLAMMPDIHDLKDYKLEHIHGIMRQIAAEDGYTFVDLLPALRGRPPEELFAMPGDPHPNALGHRLMADALFPVFLQQTAGAKSAMPGK
jgi:lysophospholipase L1-like esterase